MPIQTRCSWCGRTINACDTFAGKAVKCPGCGGTTRIPPAVKLPTRDETSPPPAATPSSQPPPLQPGPASEGYEVSLHDRWGSPPEAQTPQPDGSTFEIAAAPPAVPIPGMIYDAEDMSGRVPAAPPTPDDMRRPCIACGELIMRDATKCRFCGEVFEGSLARSGGRRRVAVNDDEMAAVDWAFAVLCPPIGCIMAIAYLVQGKSKGGKMLGISILFTIIFSVANTVLQNLNRREPDIEYDYEFDYEYDDD